MFWWFLIFLSFLSIRNPENKFRFAEHDNAYSKKAIKEGEGESQTCFPFTQEGLAYSGSSQTDSNIPHLVQASFQGQQLFADHTCCHVRDYSVAMQMVHEAQQSQGIEMWEMRLSMAHLHRPHLHTWWTSQTRRGLDLYGLARCRWDRKSVQESFGIAAQFQKGTNPQIEKKEEKQGKFFDSGARSTLEQQNNWTGPSCTITEHCKTNRQQPREQVQSFTCSFGETGQLRRSATIGRGRISEDCIISPNAHSCQEVGPSTRQISRRTEGTAEPSRVVDEVPRRIHQEMDHVCGGLRQERSRARDQGPTDQGKIAGSSTMSRRDQGGSCPTGTKISPRRTSSWNQRWTKSNPRWRRPSAFWQASMRWCRIWKLSVYGHQTTSTSTLPRKQEQKAQKLGLENLDLGPLGRVPECCSLLQWRANRQI